MSLGDICGTIKSFAKTMDLSISKILNIAYSCLSKYVSLFNWEIFILSPPEPYKTRLDLPQLSAAVLTYGQASHIRQGKERKKDELSIESVDLELTSKSV